MNRMAKLPLLLKQQISSEVNNSKEKNILLPTVHRQV
jgi:hypothetical protein